MRFAAFVILAGALLSGLSQRTSADEAKPPVTGDSHASIETHNSTASSSGEQWRFRRHQGRWWYWLPSEKWVYWNDGGWVNYDPATYAALERTQTVRRYSYSNDRGGYSQLGKWGPIRYDGYGNRQYPYSMRRSGIRQLGPVPAMGGVRSLPGWGGER